MKFDTWALARAFIERNYLKFNTGELVPVTADGPLDWKEKGGFAVDGAWDKLCIRTACGSNGIPRGVIAVFIERWPEGSLRNNSKPRYVELESVQESEGNSSMLRPIKENSS